MSDESHRDPLESLTFFDAPTLANAIERLGVRPRTMGYAGWDLRCVFPELGTVVGYAVTATADSTTEDAAPGVGLDVLWEAVAASRKPVFLVLKDVGRDRVRSCHLGEVMATTAKALGAVGCITDGGLRDVNEIRRLGNFQLYCPGFVVSHGNPVICAVGSKVEISGMAVEPGDILCGDVNGIMVVPEEVVERLPEEAERVRAMEREILDFVRSPDFSLSGLRHLRSRFRH